MDFNFQRRKREKAIAKEIALAGFTATATLPTQDLTMATERLTKVFSDVVTREHLDGASVVRVAGYLNSEIDRMNAEVADANRQTLTMIDHLETAMKEAA